MDIEKLPTAAEVREMANKCAGILDPQGGFYAPPEWVCAASSVMLLQFADLLEREQSQAQKISFLISVVKSGEQLTETEEEMLRNPDAHLLPPPEAK